MITSFVFLAQAAASPTGSPLTQVIPFLCIGVIFYFLIIRPQGKRQKELASLVSSLKTGDKVVTSAGIHGIIANVKEGNTLILKVADNVKIEIDKSAIAKVESTDKAEKAEKTPAIASV
jgi:preprotein translocase subunit YajC